MRAEVGANRNALVDVAKSSAPPGVARLSLRYVVDNTMSRFQHIWIKDATKTTWKFTVYFRGKSLGSLNVWVFTYPYPQEPHTDVAVKSVGWSRRPWSSRGQYHFAFPTELGIRFRAVIESPFALLQWSTSSWVASTHRMLVNAICPMRIACSPY